MGPNRQVQEDRSKIWTPNRRFQHDPGVQRFEIWMCKHVIKKVILAQQDSPTRGDLVKLAQNKN